MDEISPNFAHFLRLVNSRSIIEKKAGDTKKWIALNISLDMGCSLFRDGQILKNMSKEL